MHIKKITGRTKKCLDRRSGLKVDLPAMYACCFDTSAMATTFPRDVGALHTRIGAEFTGTLIFTLWRDNEIME